MIAPKHLATAIALAIVVAFVGRLRADNNNSVEVYMTTRPADLQDPKQAGKAPSIEVTVVGGPKVPIEKFSLSTTNNGQKVTLKPEKLREYAEGTETIAIALVICGQEIWIGNEDVEQDPNAKYEGVLKNLQAAIDKLQLGAAEPPGSKGLVVSYSTGAEIKVPMGDLKLISGAALGVQKDYQHKVSTDMVSGVTLGLYRAVEGIDGAQGADRRRRWQRYQPGCRAGSARRAEEAGHPAGRTDVRDHLQVRGVDRQLGDHDDDPDRQDRELDRRHSGRAQRHHRAHGRSLLPDGSRLRRKNRPGVSVGQQERDVVLKIDQLETEAVSLTLSPAWAPG